MTKQSVACGVFALLAVISFVTLTFAQNPAGKAAKGRCEGYPVITPPAGVDYKLRVVKPPEDVKYSGVIIDPCAAPEVKSAMAAPAKPEGAGKAHLTVKPEGAGKAGPNVPAFQLVPTEPRTYQSPSEALKGYALPAEPPKQ